jgi:hypothetical protein
LKETVGFISCIRRSKIWLTGEDTTAAVPQSRQIADLLLYETTKQGEIAQVDHPGVLAKSH